MMKYMDEGLKRWIHSTDRQNLWKVGAWYDLDDLVQDGYMVYCKCLKNFKKGDNPENEEPARFMAYFKFAFMNHLRDLANSRTRTLDNSFSDVSTERDEEVAALEIPFHEEASLHMALVQAPKEIVEVLSVLVQDAKDAGSYLRTRLRKRKTANGSTRLVKGRAKLRETTQ